VFWELGVFDWLTQLQASPLTYLVVLGACALDAVLPIVPSEAVAIAASVLAARGELWIWLVAVAAAAGGFLGDDLHRRNGAAAVAEICRCRRGWRHLVGGVCGRAGLSRWRDVQAAPAVCLPVRSGRGAAGHPCRGGGPAAPSASCRGWWSGRGWRALGAVSMGSVCASLPVWHARGQRLRRFLSWRVGRCGGRLGIARPASVCGGSDGTP
jgi:hypothetical protein